MRHRKKLNHLGRKSDHRKAMLANMATSLILHKRVKTTVAKAKALRIYIEPLLTKSKNDSTHSRRIVFSYLQDKDAVSELFREISPKIADRPGGYTRVLKIGNRIGDSAEMCIIELVDYNENLLAAKNETVTKTGRRRRRGGKKKIEVEGQQAHSNIKKSEAILNEQKATETNASDSEALKTDTAENQEITDSVQKKQGDTPAPADENLSDKQVSASESEADETVVKEDEKNKDIVEDKKIETPDNEEKETGKDNLENGEKKE